MIIDDPDTMKSWLVQVLQPLCEADPEALAKYVMALIKKDKSDDDLKKICLDQLDVFLTNNTEKFVDKLFVALKNKSYNNTSPVKSSDVSKPEEKAEFNSQVIDTESRRRRSRSRSPRRGVPSNKPSPSSSSRGRRNLDRSAVKRTDEPKSSTNFNKYSTRGRDRRSTSRSRSPSPSRNSRSNKRSRSPYEKDVSKQSRKRSASRSPDREVKRKERCRDFDEKGVCLRGDLCPFDHGSDPVVLDAATGPIFGLNGPPAGTVMPSQPLTVPPSVVNPPWQDYDQGNPSIEHRPPNMMMPHMQGPRHPGHSWNTGPQFGPRPPLIGHMPPATGRPNLSMIIPEEQGSLHVEDTNRSQPNHHNNVNNQLNQPNSNMSNSQAFQGHSGGQGMASGDTRGHPSLRGASSRGRGFGRGRGRGFGRQGPPRMLDQPEKCTLEVRRLPVNLNTISALNEYFSKFGTIVNLQVRYQGDPEAAVVQFSSHSEASSAHRCPEAVLGNRFIKLFWHNKDQEKQDPAPEKDTPIEENSSSRQVDDSNKKEEPEDDDKNRIPVKERLDLKPSEDFPGKASRPVLNPNLLRKSNVEKPVTEAPVVPMIKTRSEQKKEKLLKNIEIRKKTEQLLSTLRKDQTSIGEKLINAKTKEERTKLKKIFDLLDVKRKETEEELKKISEELLNDCSNHGKPMRGRRGLHHMPRGGGHAVHAVKKEILKEKKAEEQEEDEKPLPGESDDGGRLEEEEVLEDPLPAVSSQE